MIVLSFNVDIHCQFNEILVDVRNANISVMGETAFPEKMAEEPKETIHITSTNWEDTI